MASSEDFQLFLGNKQLKKLCKEENVSCEGLLTYDECERVVSSLENNESPGSDGLTSEFY